MKVFLDFGGNKGQGLKEFVKMYNMDSTWTIETFEPNENCEIERYLPNMSIKINNSAIWVYNGFVNFSNMIENNEGSSVECLMSEGDCLNPNSDSFRKHDNIISVKCLDISEVLERYRGYDLVVVKMDIEGSEFKVLRKAISDDSISIINDLYVEWHHVYVVGEDIQSVNKLKSEIINKGIKLSEWH